MFKIKLKFGLTFIILFLSAGSLHTIAQEYNLAVIFNPLIDDITQRIPTLQDMIDSAYIHSPLLKVADADVSIAKYDITTIRREWMDYFYLDGLMVKDYYNGLTTNEVVNTSPNQILTNQDNFRLTAGLSVRLPMLSFWDLHNKVKNATKKMERAISVRENQKLELRKEIITRYNQLIVNQRMLKIANDNITFSALHKDMAEKEFINGQSNLFEVARVSEMHRKAVADFENARFEFYNAYMILQEIVGTKFNVIYKID